MTPISICRRRLRATSGRCWTGPMQNCRRTTASPCCSYATARPTSTSAATTCSAARSPPPTCKTTSRWPCCTTQARTQRAWWTASGPARVTGKKTSSPRSSSRTRRSSPKRAPRLTEPFTSFLYCKLHLGVLGLLKVNRFHSHSLVHPPGVSADFGEA